MDRMPYALVVESDPFALQLIAQTLTSTGFRSKSVRGQTEALREIEQECPDVVLSEMCLVEGSGLALAVEARTLPAFPRIVLMARNPSRESLIEAFRCGVTDILLKPVNRSAIRAAIERVLSPVRPPEASWLQCSPPVQEPEGEHVAVAIDRGMKQVKKDLVMAALHRCHGNKSAAARALGIERRSIYRILHP